MNAGQRCTVWNGGRSISVHVQRHAHSCGEQRIIVT